VSTDTELLAVVVDGSVPDPFDAAVGLGAVSAPRTAVGEGRELAGGAALEGDGNGTAVGDAALLAVVARGRSAI